MRVLYVASDNTNARTYTLGESESGKILELAMVYGRGETGEIVTLYDDDTVVARACWDSQYRKYRKY